MNNVQKFYDLLDKLGITPLTDEQHEFLNNLPIDGSYQRLITICSTNTDLGTFQLIIKEYQIVVTVGRNEDGLFLKADYTYQHFSGSNGYTCIFYCPNDKTEFERWYH